MPVSERSGLTYPQKSCCSAVVEAAIERPSGFALMRAKSLILLGLNSCQQMGQSSLGPEESRLWATSDRFSHKVIHKICGQQEKRFPIIDLDPISQLHLSFHPQLRHKPA